MKLEDYTFADFNGYRYTAREGKIINKTKINMSVNEIDVNAVNKRAKLIDPDEIVTNEKDHSNLYVGIAVGVMITVCAIIYVVASYLEAVMYV